MKPFLSIHPLLVLSTAAFLAACSNEQQQSDALPAATPAPVADTIIVYSWGEYLDESLHERFTKETGIKVDYQTYESGDEMTELIKSNPGNYDVVVMDDQVLQRMRRTRIVRELDRSLLPNLRHIDEEHISKSADNAIHSAPYLWGSTLIAYNKKYVHEPEKSWSILFDPKMKGKTSLIDDRMECMTNMLHYLGYPADSEDESQIRDATQKLLELANEQEVVLGSDVEANERIQKEEVWAAMIYSVDLAQALEEDEEDKIGYFHPREGTTKYVDNFTIPRDSKKWREAHRYINFMMDPKVGAESSVWVRGATANLTAQEEHLKQMDPQLLNSVTFEKPSKATNLVEGSPNRQRLIHEGWQAFEKAIIARADTKPNVEVAEQNQEEAD